MSGKGSRPRPLSVSQSTFDEKFDSIFGNKPKKEQYVPPALPEIKEEKKKIEWVVDSTEKENK